MREMIERIQKAGLPDHVAIIMDGNGRWAKARGLPRTAGHQAGTQAAERLIRFATRDLGLRYLTLYAFSTENWSRPTEEVDFLLDLLDRFITEKLREFVEEGVHLTVLGDLTPLSPRLRETVERAIAATADNTKLHLNVALNYGARQEIIRACRALAKAAAQGELDPGAIGEEEITAALYTARIPDPDLIIRTSGEMRLSNFLLWQAAYTELYFTPTLWPDFTPEELMKAIEVYQQRERRFGGVSQR